MLKSLGALRPCRKASGTLCCHDLRYQQQGCGDATCVSDIGLHFCRCHHDNKKKTGWTNKGRGMAGKAEIKERRLMSVCGVSVETSQGHTIGSSRSLMIL